MAEMVTNVFNMFCCRKSNPASELEEVKLLQVDAERAQQHPPKAESSGCCQQCVKVSCSIFGVLLVLILLVVLRIFTASPRSSSSLPSGPSTWWSTSYSLCAVEEFDYRYVLLKNAKDAGLPRSPFDRGTSENMDLMDLDVDLQGVWWMHGLDPTMGGGNLVSFASARGEKPFPAIVHDYSLKQRRRTWTDSKAARLWLLWYAVTAEPDSPVTFNFTNSSWTSYIPVGNVGSNLEGNYGFKKINDNEWDRLDAGYVLRRVVNGDGSEGRFWQNFTKWYDGIEPRGKVIVWSSDSSCLRRCQFFAPCSLCDAVC